MHIRTLPHRMISNDATQRQFFVVQRTVPLLAGKTVTSHSNCISRETRPLDPKASLINHQTREPQSLASFHDRDHHRHPLARGCADTARPDCRKHDDQHVQPRRNPRFHLTCQAQRAQHRTFVSTAKDSVWDHKTSSAASSVRTEGIADLQT